MAAARAGQPQLGEAGRRQGSQFARNSSFVRFALARTDFVFAFSLGLALVMHVGISVGEHVKLAGVPALALALDVADDLACLAGVALSPCAPAFPP